MQFPIGLNATWQPPEALQLTQALEDWLLDAGSLTAKLKQVHPDFRVQVLAQEQQLAEPHEYRTLGIDVEPVTIREVLLYSNNVPWVFCAQHIAPSTIGRACRNDPHGHEPAG